MTPALLDKLRCVAPSGGNWNQSCRGRLNPFDDQIRCELCSQVYPVIEGVPIIHRDSARNTSDNWYEKMFRGRSRTAELNASYLKEERNLINRFANKLKLSGPCLEVGCGVGLFADEVPGYIGLEYAIEALLVDGFQSYDRVCADASNLPFASGSMQIIFSFNVFEHVREVDRAFAELHRVCAVGGYLVIKPAWHCTRYTTELIPILPYSELSWKQKITKALLPILRFRGYKFLSHVPWRLWRRIFAGKLPSLKWTGLQPYHGPLWHADADAEASLDCHEGILFFIRQNYSCLSHATLIQQLLAGHDVVILQKYQEETLDVNPS